MTSDTKGALKDMTDSAGKAAGDVSAKIQDQASSLKDQAQGAADKVSDTATDFYGRAKEQVKNAAGDLPGHATDALAAGERAYHKGSDEVKRHVKQQPIEALLLAGAVGYLVGWATTRG